MKAATISSRSTVDLLRRRATWCALPAMFAAQYRVAADVETAERRVAEIIRRIGGDARAPRPTFVGCKRRGCAWISGRWSAPTEARRGINRKQEPPAMNARQ